MLVIFAWPTGLATQARNATVVLQNSIVRTNTKLTSVRTLGSDETLMQPAAAIDTDRSTPQDK
jgi:hypothetical protein